MKSENNVIHVNFGTGQKIDREDPCSVCPAWLKSSCTTTCKKAEQYWIKVANRLKGNDV